MFKVGITALLMSNVVHAEMVAEAAVPSSLPYFPTPVHSLTY